MARGGFNPHDDKDAQAALRDAAIERIEHQWNMEVCKCGDYRKQHQNGTGPSLLNWDNSRGVEPCMKFRFAHPCSTPMTRKADER